jgi:Stage II sporulation protein E (SpoIIE)
VAIVVTEAVTNLHKHAKNGQIVIQGVMCGSTGGMDVLALDQGPGMFDVSRCMADGYSTAGSPGTGLGAMARLAPLFDLYSVPGAGTVSIARLWDGAPPEHLKTSTLDFGAVSVPVEGEEVCGDQWAIKEFEGRSLILMADGLGHGLLAAEAAREAVRCFREILSGSPAEIVKAAHPALRGTRGAALAIAALDRDRREVRYAGVGNISGSILGLAEDRSFSMMSHNGTVGHTVRKVQEFTYPWAAGSLVVMHSDGLGTQWQLGRYAGLALKHPGLVAATLYRDFRRSRDDVTVVAVRERSGGPQ